MIGPFISKVWQLILKNRKTIQKAGQEAIKFYGKNRVAINTGIKIAAIAIVQYNSYRAKKYEKELQEIHKKYRKSVSVKFQKEGKKIFNRIESIIAKQNISKEEKTELMDVMKRHSVWINRSDKKLIAKKSLPKSKLKKQESMMVSMKKEVKKKAPPKKRVAKKKE